MKKQKKKRLIYSAVSAITLLSSFSTVGIAFILSPEIINRIAPEPITNSDGNKNYSYVENVDKPYYFNREIKDENVTRTPNKDIYDTPITKKYNNQFKWPSWNYNYEADPDGTGPQKQNKFQTINGVEINAAQLVYNDDYSEMTVTDNKGVKQYLKFSDSRFILEEIKNNRLKKHPAADVWFEQQISDTEKAVDVFYSIPSSIEATPNELIPHASKVGAHIRLPWP